MYRVLCYPRLCALTCISAMAAAVARDLCLGAEAFGWAQVLLVLTLILLCGALALLSCRFLVDAQGVGVGFLFHVRRTDWSDLGAFGALCCNGRRMYLYGLYPEAMDFFHMIHRAPQCGPWGFVVPLSRKLREAISACCPYEIDLCTSVPKRRKKGMRPVWHHAALQVLSSFVAAAVAALTAGALLLRASELSSMHTVTVLTSVAALLLYLALRFLYRAYVSVMTCPFISEDGVSAGRGLYLTWDEVRFGYVHRMAQVSGLFLLSEPIERITQINPQPICCLSMPDASSLVLAYLTYCPHASKAVEARGLL